jgi:hypothetical protein
VLEFDEKTGYYYYFNMRTGESRWAEEEEVNLDGSDDAGGGVVESKNSRSRSGSGKSQTNPIFASVDGRMGKRRSSGGEGDEQGEGNGPGDLDESTGSGGEKVEMLPTSRRAAEVYRRTQGVVKAFTGEAARGLVPHDARAGSGLMTARLVPTAMFVFHGCCCEGPMAVVEGAIRAPGASIVIRFTWGVRLTRSSCHTVYFVGSMLLLVVGLLTCQKETLRRSLLWLRESVLLICATCSLIIPGVSLCVYRKFDPDKDEWDLSAIPTPVGHVDPRHFYTFSLGQGSMAANAFYDRDLGMWATTFSCILSCAA